MEILREVNCRVRKGLGAEWADKVVTVYFDDVEPDTSQNIINDMIRQDAKEQLERAGFEQYTIEDIHSA
mgnify:CR=1 FL=1